MKKLLIAVTLVAFTAAVALPVVVGFDSAVAAEKKKSIDKKKEKKKKPTGGM